MSRRRDGLARILAVQRDLHRAAERRLAGADRLIVELERSRDDLLRFLGTQHALSGLFAGQMSDRLRALAGQLEVAREGRRREVEAVLREGRRLKGAERLAGDVAREERKTAESRELLEAVERAAAGVGASQR